LIKLHAILGEVLHFDQSVLHVTVTQHTVTQHTVTPHTVTQHTVAQHTVTQHTLLVIDWAPKTESDQHDGVTKDEGEKENIDTNVYSNFIVLLAGDLDIDLKLIYHRGHRLDLMSAMTSKRCAF
jgi:hypothetical protein